MELLTQVRICIAKLDERQRETTNALNNSREERLRTFQDLGDKVKNVETQLNLLDRKMNYAYAFVAGVASIISFTASTIFKKLGVT